MAGNGRGAVDLIIAVVSAAAGRLADCRDRESELDGQRSMVKSEAIARIMSLPDPQKDGKTYSATAAADVVMNDKVFALHERDRRAATAATIRAMGDYQAARLRAEFAVRAGDMPDFSGAETILEPTLGDDHKVAVVQS